MQVRLCDEKGGRIGVLDASLYLPFPEVIVIHPHDQFYKFRSKMMKPGGVEVDYVTYYRINPVVIVGEHDVHPNQATISEQQDLLTQSGF
jgi:hypothetical protein